MERHWTNEPRVVVGERESKHSIQGERMRDSHSSPGRAGEIVIKNICWKASIFVYDALHCVVSNSVDPWVHPPKKMDQNFRCFSCRVGRRSDISRRQNSSHPTFEDRL